MMQRPLDICYSMTTISGSYKLYITPQEPRGANLRISRRVLSFKGRYTGPLFVNELAGNAQNLTYIYSASLLINPRVKQYLI